MQRTSFFLDKRLRKDARKDAVLRLRFDDDDAAQLSENGDLGSALYGILLTKTERFMVSCSLVSQASQRRVADLLLKKILRAELPFQFVNSPTCKSHRSSCC